MAVYDDDVVLLPQCSRLAQQITPLNLLDPERGIQSRSYRSQSAELPCGSMSRSNTSRPSITNACARLIAMVVFPQPPSDCKSQ